MTAPGGVAPTIRSRDPQFPSRLRRGRAAVPRHPPSALPPRSLPAEPASVLRVVDRLGSLQFDPLEVAGRNHDLMLLARIDGYRRPWTDELLYRDRVLYETYNKMFSIVPRPSCRGTGSPGTGTTRRTAAAPSTSTRRWSRSCWSGSARGPAVVDRRRAAGRDRLVLAADQPGPRHARGARGGRDHRDLAPGGQPARLRPHRAAVPGRPARPPDPRARAASAQAAVALSRQRAPRRDRGLHAVGGHRGGAGRRRSTTSSSRRGPSRRSRSRACVGPRFVVADELPMLEAAELEVDAEGGRGAAAAGRVRAGRRVPRAARPAGLGSRPAAAAVRLRLPLGGLRPRGQAALGLLRPAPAVRGPVRRPDRAPRSTAPPRTLRVLGLWWEDGFDPLDAGHPGFVDAFAAALRAHADFAGSPRWPCRASPVIGRSHARFASGCSARRRDQPPGWRPIMPAATVLLLASSTRMNAPVARFSRYGSTNSGCVARSWIRPISLSDSSVAALVAMQRVDVDPVVDRGPAPAPSGSCA